MGLRKNSRQTHWLKCAMCGSHQCTLGYMCGKLRRASSLTINSVEWVDCEANKVAVRKHTKTMKWSGPNTSV
eukprot:1332707-Amphidinium_carterae.1